MVLKTFERIFFPGVKKEEQTGHFANTVFEDEEATFCKASPFLKKNFLIESRRIIMKTRTIPIKIYSIKLEFCSS